MQETGEVKIPADAQLAQFYASTLPWEPQPELTGFEYWLNQLHGGMPLNAAALVWLIEKRPVDAPAAARASA